VVEGEGVLIQFDEEDSDPYTKILVLQDGDVQCYGFYAFPLKDFESWLDTRTYPEDAESAVALLDEFDAIRKERAKKYHQKVLAEIEQEEAGSYEQRYARLKSQGLSESEIHARLFPEEYDFMFDDHVDYKMRQQGGNPMSQSYTDKVNARRAAGGFAPVGDSGDSSETMAWCNSQKEVIARATKLPSSYEERYERFFRQRDDDRSIHKKLFPEEYDVEIDTPEEAALRAKGVNPKNQGYQNYVNKRRIAGGFSEFSNENDGGTMDWCIAQRKIMEDK